MTIALIILLAVPPVVAVMAAVRDLTTMTIPNWMSLVLAALSLWMGLEGAAIFVLWTGVIGGLFSLALILARARFAAWAPAAPGWIGRLLAPGGDIPYGVAIAAGALLAWPYSTLMTTAF